MAETQVPPEHLDAERVAELRRGLDQVRGRIERACAAAGRSAGSVRLVVVTKFFPVGDVAALVSLGVEDIGESRDQEASAKMADLLAVVGARSMPTVHMIGQVQTKKARSLVRYAGAVHSVDRDKLIEALDRASGAAIEHGERVAPLDVAVQVDLAGGGLPGRGGAPPKAGPALAAAVAERAHLRLCGVMAIAPADLDSAQRRAAFGALAQCHRGVLAEHPGATWMSAGMSGDLEDAVAAGATHLRVGRAILGSRPRHR